MVEVNCQILQGSSLSLAVEGRAGKRALRITVLAIVFVGTAYTPAAAAEKSTAEMLEFCQAAVRVTEGTAAGAEIGPGGYCLGFIDGLVSTTQLYRRFAFERGVGWNGGCWPDGVLLLHYVRVFVTYAIEHPEYRQESATWTGLTAFNETWPCP